MYQKQIDFEDKYNKNQLIKRLREEFSDPELLVIMEKADIPHKFGIDLLVQMCLHKRCSVSTLIGTLRNHCNNINEIPELLLKAVKADLVDWNNEIEQFIIVYDISEDVQQEIDTYQYPLPMLVRPLLLENNKDTGYFTFKSSVILKNNHHDNDVCLDHLNRSNQVPLTVNQNVVKYVQNKWKNLDKVKPGETKADLDKRRKAFAKYDRCSKEVIKTVSDNSDNFYLTHRYDKRGRTYSCGYHINYQSNPWCKAVVEFANKELCE